MNDLELLPKKYKKIFNKRCILNLLILLVSTVICFLAIKFQKNEYFNSLENSNFFYVISLIITFLIIVSIQCLIIFVVNNQKIQVHKKFFYSALVIGIFYIFLTPFLMGADELGHFCRIYEISMGNFITPRDGTNMLPSSIKEYQKLTNSNFKYSDIKEYMLYELNADNVESYGDYYVSISLYSPIQYIPQAIGVGIGRVLDLSIGITGYLGRLTGFIFWLIIVTYAIKIVPNKKTFFAVLFLSPICIRYATTLSGDMMLNSITLLFICYIYKIWYDKKTFVKKDFIILAILSFIISLCKIVYIPIVFALFFIPKECFKNKKEYWVKLGIICIVSVMLTCSWFLISNTYLDGFYGNSDEQKQFIFSNPITYIVIMINTLYKYFINFVSYNMDIPTTPILSIIAWIIIVCSLWSGKEEKRNIKFINKLLYVVISVGVIVLMLTALYIQYTAMVATVGNPIIEGVQTRYFVPIIILSALIITKNRIKINQQKLLLAMIILNVPILIEIFMWYMN